MFEQLFYMIFLCFSVINELESNKMYYIHNYERIRRKILEGSDAKKR